MLESLKKNKTLILFILFWTLVVLGAINYMTIDLKKENNNKQLIERNYEELLKKDSAHYILLKNDSIIFEKLEEILKK